MGKSSVADIAESTLCCSCGACAWACPEKAISYVETMGGGTFFPKFSALGAALSLLISHGAAIGLYILAVVSHIRTSSQ